MKDKNERVIYTFLVTVKGRRVVIVTTACNFEDALDNLSKNSGFANFNVVGCNICELDNISIVKLGDLL